MRTNQTLTGILCLIAGIGVFSVQDVILKLLSGDYPLHQAMVIRSLAAMPFLLLFARVFDGRLSTLTTPRWHWMLARGLLNFTAYTAYYLGLAALPMPTTVALFFTGPLLISLAAAVFLRERVPPASALAVGVGFAGVLLIVHPAGNGLGWAAALPVLGAAGYALSMVSARPLGRTETAAAMAFWGNACFLLCALVLSAIWGFGGTAATADPALAFLTRGWVQPPLRDLMLMASCGGIAAVGLTLLTHAYRVAPSSAVAPFEYSFMFWAVLWGWMFWGDLPEPLAWAGIAVIVAAGLYLIRRETGAREEAAQGEGSPSQPGPVPEATQVTNPPRP